ncbi:hypothetical protein BDW59DRAFT_156162 [Aspergillus cavernicola]|uniref:Zn(2)-C6 fungal-type domain-containing protein n=1 Tax=Aspergillus cavernicola TaxID=176166 RepID=A0ABR4J2G2_9EURO
MDHDPFSEEPFFDFIHIPNLPDIGLDLSAPDPQPNYESDLVPWDQIWSFQPLDTSTGTTSIGNNWGLLDYFPPHSDHYPPVVGSLLPPTINNPPAPPTGQGFVTPLTPRDDILLSRCCSNLGYNNPGNGSTPLYPVLPLSERSYSQGSSATATQSETSNYSFVEGIPTTPAAKVTKSNTKKRKRGTYDSANRERVKNMRSHGACMRCRIYRIQCDQNSPCGNCNKVRDTALIFKQPCVRVFLKEVLPFRAGNSRTGGIRSTFPRFSWSYDYPQVKEIEVRHPWAGLAGGDKGQLPTLRIRCKQFVPGAAECMSESYESAEGGTMIIEFPPFACPDADTERMHKAMGLYLDASVCLAEKAIDAETSDELILLTLKEARRYASAKGCSTIVANALKILAAGYISEIQPVIVSGDTLGIPLIQNERFKYHNQRPIPIALDYQIDNLYIAYMQRNLEPLLRGLDRLIYKARKTERKETWYEIFLTVFVLLFSLEEVFDKQISFVRKYEKNDANIFAAASYVKRTMIDEWRSSAKNLIWHFRCVVRGMVPFETKWTPEAQQEAKLDDESLAFVKEICQIVSKRRKFSLKLASVSISN